MQNIFFFSIVTGIFKAAASSYHAGSPRKEALRGRSREQTKSEYFKPTTQDRIEKSQVQ